MAARSTSSFIFGADSSMEAFILFCIVSKYGRFGWLREIEGWDDLDEEKEKEKGEINSFGHKKELFGWNGRCFILNWMAFLSNLICMIGLWFSKNVLDPIRMGNYQRIKEDWAQMMMKLSIVRQKWGKINY